MIVNIYTVGSYAAIYSAGENIAPQSKVTASTAGGDAGSNAASVIDGMTQNTSGIYKWFVLNGCNGAWLSAKCYAVRGKGVLRQSGSNGGS